MERSPIKYPFSNHIIFAMVMEDPNLCKTLLERIFPGRKVREVVMRESLHSMPEATLLAGPQSKYVRLDVLFEDGNAWYDIEMQVGYERDLPRRVRYYAGMLDVKLMQQNEDYGDMKPSFVIFLCRFDYYKQEEAIYCFQRYDRNLHLPMADDSYIMVLNTKCAQEKVPDGLKSLFRYINDCVVIGDDPFIRQIDMRVRAIQEDEEVKNIMTLEEFYIRENAGARREGLEKGREEGEARINRLYLLLRKEDRMDDLFRAMEDDEYRAQLLQEFGL